MMSSDDWYRRTTWSDADSEDFHARLKRARKHNRPQYLRIQACHLAREKRHAAALELLDEYLSICDNDIDLAQAHLQRAESLTETGDHHAAITAFRQALDAERHRPNVQTETWLRFPWFIVENQLFDLYDEASATLSEFSPDRDLTFPMSEYRFNAVLALLAVHGGDITTAKAFAQKAIDASKVKQSGFRYHPDVGLVHQPATGVHQRVTEIATS